ncbi:hypothetical protein SmJEL517_g05874 [Synchytrium microbalum]|uniref:FAD/NAD(P)-binding domain-containing protein n=1 Tax=Synchytrium microbalum TaxID=1806994 RepID=A0A507BTJ3_9FUNG|nr:uncharacterized protein SmJEL517_g05874 [Synchytrium microbalum]TPX30591.1 hypothetical protein SmJEL517_g05874 [Synchytrium microbalum]
MPPSAEDVQPDVSQLPAWEYYPTPRRTGMRIVGFTVIPALYKLVCIGAGCAGVYMAYRVPRALKDVSLVIYDKNPSLGGTWLENRYPGCACDIAAHHYSWSFELNPNWTSSYAGAEEIWRYQDAVADKYDCKKYMKFNTRITDASFDEKAGVWKLTGTGANGEAITDECEVLVSGMGALNSWKWPDIKGLEDFKGKKMHTAAWDQKYDLTGKTVACIGTGASAIQTIPKVQKVAAHLDVYQRSPVWVPSMLAGDTVTYTEAQKQRWRDHPEELKAFYDAFCDGSEDGFKLFMANSPGNKEWLATVLKRYETLIPDPAFRKKVTPDYDIGCRRITPHETYLQAIQEKNVDLIVEKIDHIVANGVVTKDGVLHPVDVLITATGFDTSFIPRVEITGLGGLTLKKAWSDISEGYLGTAVAQFPNYFMFLGPQTPIGQASLLPYMEAQGDYIMKCIEKMQVDSIKYMSPNVQVQREFNDWSQAYLKKTVWASSCSSWYKDAKGRNMAIWPGSAKHFINFLKTPRMEDYDLVYTKANRFENLLASGLTR